MIKLALGLKVLHRVSSCEKEPHPDLVSDDSVDALPER